MKKGIKVGLVIIIIAIIGIVLLMAMSFETVDTNTHNLNKTENLSEAQQIATQQNKHVFLVFTTDSCSWCDKLEKETLSDSKVLQKLDEKYVVAIVNVEKQPELAKSFNVIGTPVMILMDNNGVEQGRIDGYQGPEELLEYL